MQGPSRLMTINALLFFFDFMYVFFKKANSATTLFSHRLLIRFWVFREDFGNPKSNQGTYMTSRLICTSAYRPPVYVKVWAKAACCRYSAYISEHSSAYQDPGFHRHRSQPTANKPEGYGLWQVKDQPMPE